MPGEYGDSQEFYSFCFLIGAFLSLDLRVLNLFCSRSEYTLTRRMSLFDGSSGM